MDNKKELNENISHKKLTDEEIKQFAARFFSLQKSLDEKITDEKDRKELRKSLLQLQKDLGIKPLSKAEIELLKMFDFFK